MPLPETFIDFLDDGTFQAVHTELLGPSFLFDLGKAEIARASLVEFNPATQKWEVKWIQDLPTDPVRFAHPSREECIKWEVGVLSRSLNDAVSALIPRQRLVKVGAEGSPQTQRTP